MFFSNLASGQNEITYNTHKTYIHTYIHTNIYVRTHLRMYMCVRVHVCKYIAYCTYVSRIKKVYLNYPVSPSCINVRTYIFMNRPWDLSLLHS